MAGQQATVEVGGRRSRVRPVAPAADEVAALWPRILRRAPTYDRYLRAAGRDLPPVRLEPAEGSDRGG